MDFMEYLEFLSLYFNEIAVYEFFLINNGTKKNPYLNWFSANVPILNSRKTPENPWIQEV